MRTKEAKGLLETAKERYRVMTEADQENRRQAMIDLKFVNEPGQQWELNMKSERGDRPCYEFNKLRVTCKRVINDMRSNRPQGKIRAVEDGDKEGAELREGLVRNIWNISDGDTVIDYAAEYQVPAGLGAWRVSTRYSDDTAFDQDIIVEPIINPFTLYCDPSCTDLLKRDAEDWIVTEKISYKAFEARYGEAEKHDFEEETEFDDEDEWQDEDRVRIAEYWYKKPQKKELWLLQSGETVDSETDEAKGISPEMIARKRPIVTHKICYVIVSGTRVLEGPHEWAGREFPFVMVHGEYVQIDGKPYWWGLVRFAKDAQRSYNISRTSIAEGIAMSPQAKWWATADQAKGLTDQWATAHKKNFPFMLYNADGKAPGPPQRMGGADVPIALIQESQLASEEIKAVTGIFDPSLGAQSNETSGRAIYARQQQGEIATFNYQDNMGKAIRRTWEIVLDLIPEIYDTEREVRILGSDGAETYQRINTIVTGEDGKPVRVHDMASGKYDVTITVGPNFATQRQEAAETYGQLSQQFPQLMGVAGDLVFKSMDLPYAEDIAERLKVLLPPEIQKQMQSDVPPEVSQAMMQADMAMAQVQEYARLVQEANAELQEDKAEADAIQAQIKVDVAELKAAKAEFDAHVAEETAKLIQQSAGLTEKQASIIAKSAELKEKAAQIGSDIDAQNTDGIEIAARLDEVLAEFMSAAQETIRSMQEKEAQIEKAANRSPIHGQVRREGGKLVADVEYDDGTKRQIAAVREKGGLRIVPDSEGIGGENSP